MSSVNTLAQAIAQWEGYGPPQNRATRNNNPGNLKGTGYPGQVGVDPQGFAIFSSPSAGSIAQQQYLTQHLGAIASGTATGPYASLTPQSSLQDFLNIYAGNPDQGYVNGVASGAGVTPTTPIGQLAAVLGLTGASGGGVSATPAPAGASGANVGSVDAILAQLSMGSGAGVTVNPLVVGGLAAAAGLVAYALLS